MKEKTEYEKYVTNIRKPFYAIHSYEGFYFPRDAIEYYEKESNSDKSSYYMQKIMEIGDKSHLELMKNKRKQNDHAWDYTITKAGKVAYESCIKQDYRIETAGKRLKSLEKRAFELHKIGERGDQSYRDWRKDPYIGLFDKK